VQTPLIQLRPEGLYCEAGDFYIDAWRPVHRAIVTHGHSDHARWGHQHYLCATTSKEILRTRLGEDISVQTLEFGESLDMNGVKVSLHPAGHILGSAQVRVEHRGEVWVFSGDYKTEPDVTTEAFEAVRCHTFITETTFGLPIYRWRPEREVFAEINDWWRDNQAKGESTLLMGYSLGKAQRLLAGVDPSIGPIFIHGSVTSLNRCYREAGRKLPETQYAHTVGKDFDFSKALIVAPPSVQGTPWLRRFGAPAVGFASGWMTIRGAKRRRGIERGFVLSDHVDWPSLLSAVAATGAERVLTTHGYADASARYFREQGLDSQPLNTEFESEDTNINEEVTDEPVS
jgi:putative mRNA 3-end processing factor